jgi:ECF sigma factor
MKLLRHCAALHTVTRRHLPTDERATAGAYHRRLGEAEPDFARRLISKGRALSPATLARIVADSGRRFRQKKTLSFDWGPLTLSDCFLRTHFGACLMHFIMNEVTQLLSAIEQGDTRAADQLFSLVCEALRERAAAG